MWGIERRETFRVAVSLNVSDAVIVLLHFPLERRRGFDDDAMMGVFNVILCRFLNNKDYCGE